MEGRVVLVDGMLAACWPYEERRERGIGGLTMSDGEDNSQTASCRLRFAEAAGNPGGSARCKRLLRVDYRPGGSMLKSAARMRRSLTNVVSLGDDCPEDSASIAERIEIADTVDARMLVTRNLCDV